jgi:hypothetical protein
MHPQRLFALICAGIGLIACFLPWTGGDLTGSYNAAYEFWWGWIAILLNASIVWIAVSGKRKTGIPMGAARLMVFVASGFILLETLALVIIMAIFPLGSAQYGIYITLGMAVITLIVVPMINEKGKIDIHTAGHLADEFGNNAEKAEKQIDHLSDQVREGWRQGKKSGNKN